MYLSVDDGDGYFNNISLAMDGRSLFQIDRSGGILIGDEQDISQTNLDTKKILKSSNYSIILRVYS